MARDGSVWQNPNGNRNVPYLNRNGSERNLHLNWVDNRWNDNCRFAAVRNCLCFPVRYGVLFCRLSHPPSQHLPYFA